MFTVADIRNIAIQIEYNGEKTYRDAGEKSVDPEIAEIFYKMAEDEKRHARWFESIQSEKLLTEEERDIEAAGRTILQEMVKNKTFSLEQNSLNKIDKLEDLLLQSAGFEQDTILFYEMLSGFIEDDETILHLNMIIAEERRHLEELHKMKDNIKYNKITS